MNSVAKQGKAKAAEITPPCASSSSSTTKKRRVAHFTPSVNCKAKIIIEHLADGSVQVVPNQALLDPCENIHCLHDMNDSDRKKRASGLKSNAKVDIVRGYGPTDVRDVVQNAFANAGVGAEYITRHDTNNLCTATERRVAPAADVILDIIAGIKHLEVLRKRQREAKTVIHNYDTQNIDCGVLLYNQDGIDALKKWGGLVLMDSTHKTQKWKWRLFTLTVRDKYGSY